MLKELLKSQKNKNINNESYDEYGRLIVNKNLVNELLSMIKEEKTPLVITPEDLKIIINSDLPNSSNYQESPFKNLSDIVAVHISPVAPINDTIITKENAGLTNEMSIVDPNTGIQHDIPYAISNDTIHFTLNCTVHNHDYGNDWDNYEYGFMIGFDKLNKNQILDVKGEDTYLDGDVILDNKYFLFCPLGKREEVEKNNPNAIIIEYDGITLSEAISYMIVLSGKKLEPYGTYGWNQNYEYSLKILDTYKLEKMVISKGYPVIKGKFGNALHSETKYMTRRMWKREYEALINLMKYIQEKNLDVPEEILPLIMFNGGVYNLPGTVPVTFKLFKEIVFPIFSKYGYKLDDSIFEGLQENQKLKIINYPYIDIPSWETEVRTRIIKILKETIQKTKKDNR